MKIEHVKFSEILAMAFSIFSVLMGIGFLGRMISKSKLIETIMESNLNT